MSILDTLLTKGSNYSKLNGADASTPNFQDSKFIEGDETKNPRKLNINPGDSSLDLDNNTPEKYLENLPK